MDIMLIRMSFIFAFIIFSLGGCGAPPLESKIIDKVNGTGISQEDLRFFENYVKEMPSLILERKGKKALGYFSKDFEGPSGENYKALKKGLVKSIKKSTISKYSITSSKIWVSPGRARLVLETAFEDKGKKAKKKKKKKKKGKAQVVEKTVTEIMYWQKEEPGGWKIHFWDIR